VSLYTPDRVYFSLVWFLRVSVLWVVFTVRSAILRLVLLNVLVMKLVFFPTYVNVAHLRAVTCVFGWCFLGLGLCVFLRVDRVGVVVHDVMDYILLPSVFVSL
jgi:hypothetical protein